MWCKFGHVTPWNWQVYPGINTSMDGLLTYAEFESAIYDTDVVSPLPEREFPACVENKKSHPS